MFYLMTFALKYEHVSAVEGAPNGSSEDTPTTEVEIKGALEVTTALHGGALVSAKEFTKQFSKR